MKKDSKFACDIGTFSIIEAKYILTTNPCGHSWVEFGVEFKCWAFEVWFIFNVHNYANKMFPRFQCKDLRSSSSAQHCGSAP